MWPRHFLKRSNARGRVLQWVIGLTQGMEMVSTDPKGTGITVLRSPRLEVRVWQNRKGWSSMYGSAMTLDGLPSGATRLDVYSWNGLSRTQLMAYQVR